MRTNRPPVVFSSQDEAVAWADQFTRDCRARADFWRYRAARARIFSPHGGIFHLRHIRMAGHWSPTHRIRLGL